jgi:hypothetical protein
MADLNPGMLLGGAGVGYPTTLMAAFSIIGLNDISPLPPNS